MEGSIFTVQETPLELSIQCSAKGAQLKEKKFALQAPLARKEFAGKLFVLSKNGKFETVTYIMFTENKTDGILKREKKQLVDEYFIFIYEGRVIDMILDGGEFVDLNTKNGR